MEFTFPLHLLKIAKSEIKIVHLILHFTAKFALGMRGARDALLKRASARKG